MTVEHFGWDAIPQDHAARHGFPLARLPATARRVVAGAAAFAGGPAHQLTRRPVRRGCHVADFDAVALTGTDTPARRRGTAQSMSASITSTTSPALLTL